MPTGIYISVPFCRSKCSFCNFASGVFSRGKMLRYVERIADDMRSASAVARAMGAVLDRSVDSVYLGGGTPTTLSPEQLCTLFTELREHLDVAPDAEITVECAPGTLNPAIMEALTACGVNRVSLGVQSFVDEESRAVGRLHNQQIALEDIAALRLAGISDINVDLIAGLPHQSLQSWDFSLDAAVATGIPHISVYMLEVDEDSRLGRELIAGGVRYHAHHVPDDDLTALMYTQAIERLTAQGISQYEISNFARPGRESLHNLKYWTRQPYLGFGVDAHSMLHTSAPDATVRFYITDDLDEYMREPKQDRADRVSNVQALEEEFFLGLRLNRGISIKGLESRYGADRLRPYFHVAESLEREGLLARDPENFALTARGRLLSNEVFARFLGVEENAVVPSR